MICRNGKTRETKLKAVEMYKALQKITEVLRLVADSLEATEQYGANTELLFNWLSWTHFDFP